MLGAPHHSQGLVTLEPLKGFAEAQALPGPGQGEALTFLGFSLLWVQAKAEEDFLMAMVRH